MGEPVPSDLLIGHRMNADQAFASRLNESSFSRAEWELVMSIVRFEIDRPETPSEATLQPVLDGLEDAIAATEELPSIGPAGPVAPGGSSVGFVERLRKRFFQRGGGREDRRRDAAALVGEYTALLEGLLREHSRWEELCSAVTDAG